MSRRISALIRRPGARDAAGLGGASGVPDYTTGLLQDTDADPSRVTLVSSRVSAVSSLVGADLSQATAGDRPGYESTGGPDGTGAFAFGAYSTYTDPFLTFDADIDATTQARTYYMIANPASVAGTQFVFDSTTGRFIIYVRATKLGFYNSTYRDFPPAISTGWQCWCLALSETDIDSDAAPDGDGFIDGALHAKNDAVTDTALTGTTNLGASNTGGVGFDGRVAHFRVYAGYHDTATRSLVHAYLDSLYPSIGIAF